MLLLLLALAVAGYVASAIYKRQWGRAGVIAWVVGSQALLYWQPDGLVDVVVRVILAAMFVALLIYGFTLLQKRSRAAL